MGPKPRSPSAPSATSSTRAPQAFRQAVADLPASRWTDPQVSEVRWMLEELRVSLFAQTWAHRAPVSVNRVLAALGRLLRLAPGRVAACRMEPVA
jgi:ATP-dependent helicase HrpA